MKEIDSKIDALGCTIIKKTERRGSRGLTSEEVGDRGVNELLEKI